MPLPPNASITDVINKLSELEGINQKTELASVIGSPATSTDTVAQQIVKLQDSKDLFATNLSNKGIPTINTEPIDDMVVKFSQITPAGKYASGTVTATTTTEYYQYYSNTNTVGAFSVIVSGLNFLPSKIELFCRVNNSYSTSTYFDSSLGSLNNSIRFFEFSDTTLANAQNRNLKLNSPAYVNATGFKLPVANSGTSYTWKAYE